MSAAADAGDARHAHGSHGAHDPRGDAHPAHGTMKGYLIGFVLSVILTVVPFWMVMGNVLADTMLTSIIIMALAAVQIVVHMIYFLHMNTKSEGGWTFISLVFTLTLVVITLVGSIWVMYHMDQNMMPMAPHGTPTKP